MRSHAAVGPSGSTAVCVAPRGPTLPRGAKGRRLRGMSPHLQPSPSQPVSIPPRWSWKRAYSIGAEFDYSLTIRASGRDTLFPTTFGSMMEPLDGRGQPRPVLCRTAGKSTFGAFCATPEGTRHQAMVGTFLARWRCGQLGGQGGSSDSFTLRRARAGASLATVGIIGCRPDGAVGADNLRVLQSNER